MLEDYANLAEGLLALYEATFDERWFTTARRARGRDPRALRRPGRAASSTRPTDHEPLVTRPKDIQDNATPSGGAMATLVLLRLAAFTGEAATATPPSGRSRPSPPYVARYPTAFAMWLQAIDLALAPVVEVAIVGDPLHADTRALLEVASGGYEPNRVVALLPDDARASAIPLLAARTRIDGRPTAYVCRDFACRLPVTDPDALREQLAEGLDQRMTSP